MAAQGRRSQTSTSLGSGVLDHFWSDRLIPPRAPNAPPKSTPLSLQSKARRRPRAKLKPGDRVIFSSKEIFEGKNLYGVIEDMDSGRSGMQGDIFYRVRWYWGVKPLRRTRFQALLMDCTGKYFDMNCGIFLSIEKAAVAAQAARDILIQDIEEREKQHQPKRERDEDERRLMMEDTDHCDPLLMFSARRGIELVEHLGLRALDSLRKTVELHLTPEKKIQRLGTLVIPSTLSALIPEEELESPEKVAAKLVGGLIRRFVVKKYRDVFATFRAVIRQELECRRKELEEISAKRIQRCFKLKRMRDHLRKMIEKRMQRYLWMLSPEERQAGEEKRLADARRFQYLLQNGFAVDGVHYFETKEELHEWMQQQERRKGLIKKFFSRLMNKELGGAINRWKRTIIYLREKEIRNKAAHNPELTDEEKEELEEYQQRAKDMRIAAVFSHPWHPSIAVKLPILPELCMTFHNDGSSSIDDYARFQKFRAFMAGPTDFSNWVVRGKVLIGGYHGCEARQNARKTGRSDALSAVLCEGIGNLVCLLEEHELKKYLEEFPSENFLTASDAQQPVTPDLYPQDAIRSRGREEEAPSPSGALRTIAERCSAAIFKDYVDAVMRKYRQLKKSLAIDLETSNQSLQSAKVAKTRMEMMDKSIVSKNERQHVEFKLRSATESVDQAKGAIEKLPRVRFIFFPIPRHGTPSAEEMIVVVEEIEKRLRAGESVYIFSGNGHGRVGLLSAILLTRLYGIPAADALRRTQVYHDTRISCKGKSISCPQTTEQVRMVKHIASLNEAIYKELVRRGEGEFYELRKMVRGNAVTKLTNQDVLDISLVEKKPPEELNAKYKEEEARLQELAKKEAPKILRSALVSSSVIVDKAVLAPSSGDSSAATEAEQNPREDGEAIEAAAGEALPQQVIDSSQAVRELLATQEAVQTSSLEQAAASSPPLSSTIEANEASVSS